MECRNTSRVIMKKAVEVRLKEPLINANKIVRDIDSHQNCLSWFHKERVLEKDLKIRSIVQTTLQNKAYSKKKVCSNLEMIFYIFNHFRDTTNLIQTSIRNQDIVSNNNDNKNYNETNNKNSNSNDNIMSLHGF